MHPRKFIRDSIGYVFTQYVVRAALMLRGIIAARVLGPRVNGAWIALQLMMDYGSFASLGTQQGLDQVVPAGIVAGDEVALRRLKRAGLFNILLLTLVFGAGCLVWATVRARGNVLSMWGFGGVSVGLGCVLLTNIAYYQTTLLRSHGDIGAVSRWYFLQALFGAGIGLGFLWVWGVWALLWGWFTGTLIATLVARWPARHIAPLMPMPGRASVTLVQTGLPMFVFSVSALAMRSVDRLIVLPTLGIEQLGLYGISIMALTFLLYLPDSVTYVLYPQLVRRFSEAGSNPEAIRPTVHRVIKAMAVFVPGLCGIAYLLAREGVSLILPKYLPGVTALRVLCFGAVGLAVSNLASIVLMTVGRQMLLVPAALLSTLVAAALDLAAVRSGRGITGVAWATFFTYIVNGSVLLAMTFRGIGETARATLAAVLRTFAPLAIGILLAFVLDRYLPWAKPPNNALRLARLGIACVLFVSGYVLLSAPFSRGMGLRQLASEFHVPVLGPLLGRLRRGPAPERQS